MNTELEDGAPVHATMERALRDVMPPAGIGPDAIAAGRRIRVRRRIGVAASGFAVVAVLAVVSVPLLGGNSDTAIDRTDTGEIASSPSPSTTTSGPSEVDPKNPWPDFEYPEGWWDMPADQMLAALEQRLPAGIRIVDPNADGEGPGDTSDLDVILEGPSGSGRLVLMLRPRQLSEDELPDPVTSTDAEGNEHTSVMAGGVSYARNIGCRDADLACEILRNAAGEKIGDVSTETHNGTTYHNADLLGPHGGAINLYVADSTGEKPGYEDPTAEAPILTFEQVRALLQDPVWTSFQP